MQLIDRLNGIQLFKMVTGVIGKELATDEKGHTNIIIAGVGGEGHEGKDLTDTLIVASINYTDKDIGMISIPRDLYVESPLGGMRINRVYEQSKIKWGSTEGLYVLKNEISDILNIPIQYIIKINFEAFEKIIDSVGGIDVDVEQEINDPEYPDNNFGFAPFYLQEGNQHLDGKTALKYVRSRKSSSDFDRSKRQQKVILALEQKLKMRNLLSQTGFIKKLYNSLNDSMETNMSLREILSLTDFGLEWNSKNLSLATLNDESIFRGGFLYTPLRELYGGAFVLLPAGDNFDSLRHFAQIIFYGPNQLKDYPISILNGTKNAGFASRVKSILYRFGFNIEYIGNAINPDVQNTTWYLTSPEAEKTLTFLQKLIPGIPAKQIPYEYVNSPKMQSSKLILELGKDSEQIVEKLDIFKNVVLLVPTE